MSSFNTANKATANIHKLLVSAKCVWFLLCIQLQHFYYTSLRLGRTLVHFVRYPAIKIKKITSGGLGQSFAFAVPLVGIILLCSCEKVIDVDLNNVGKKYVIDGTVINQAGCKVKISQTVNFSDASVYPAISGAVVTIKDNNGTPVTLPETSPGVYETNAITGTVAHTYTLSVSINGQLFTSTSQMPLQINFDSLYVEETSGFGDPVNLSNAVFQDPPGKGNSYNFIQYKNGKPNSTIFITNDDFTDGKLTTTTLRSFNNDDEDDVDELKTGDVVRVEMQCIDAAVYKYWYSLNQGGTGSSNNATPGNPVTNISNDALGYFSAHTVQSKSVVVQ